MERHPVGADFFPPWVIIGPRELGPVTRGHKKLGSADLLISQ